MKSILDILNNCIPEKFATPAEDGFERDIKESENTECTYEVEAGTTERGSGDGQGALTVKFLQEDMEERSIAEGKVAEEDIEESASEEDNGEKVMSLEEKEEILTNVFSDRMIKATESPFRTFSDDKQEFEGNVPFVELRRVIQQYQNGEITERMLKLLDIIIQHRNITSRQIWQMYLLKYGKYIKRNHLTKTLNHMVEKGLITQFKIVSSVGKSNYFVYSPEYNGIRLYSALESESINWKKTDMIQKPYNIKRCLAVNQFLIAFLKNYEMSYRIQGRLAWSKGNGLEDNGAVKPALELTFKQADENGLENIVFLVEVVRKYQGWKEQFTEKLERYGKYLKSVEDTQVLKQYYIIVCAESEEQLADVIQLFYQAVHVKHVPALKDSMLYLITDMDLLDGNIEEDLLYNLQGMEYDYGKKKWVDHCPDFEIPKKNLHELEVEADIIRNEEKTGAELPSDMHYPADDDKEKLALRICHVIHEAGLEFPVSVTRIAVPLKASGIDYKQAGYKRLKNMFDDLLPYFEQQYLSPTELMITQTEEFLQKHKQKEQETSENKLKEEQETDRHGDSEPRINSPEGQSDDGKRKKDVSSLDIIEKYILYGMAGKRKWNQQFRSKFFVKNWDMTVALLNKMTQNYDFSTEGWKNIIAYSYQEARTEGTIMQSGKYMCFNTGIQTYSYDRIFMVAEKNVRVSPEYVLVGISTANSKVLGEIIKKEFGCLLEGKEKIGYFA